MSLSICAMPIKAIPHNSKCRYSERGAADAKPKAQIILDAAKVSAASGGCSEPKQGQRSQSARGFCPEARCGYRNPTLSSILATQMPCRTPSRSEALRSATAACGGSWRGDPPERCLSRKAGIMRCCLRYKKIRAFSAKVPGQRSGSTHGGSGRPHRPCPVRAHTTTTHSGHSGIPLSCFWFALFKPDASIIYLFSLYVNRF